jgi:superfamily II DNA or RNA helicase
LNKLITNNHTTNFYNHLISSLEKCNSFIFNVAFVSFSGVQLLLDTFKKLEEKSIKGKILTSTYLNFTDPKALEKLLSFKNIELKIYNSDETNIGFHPKAYIFEYENEYKTIIGSSNITATAFKTNIEWNIQTMNKEEDSLVVDIFKEFNNLWENSIYVNNEFLCEYSLYKKDIQKQKSFTYKNKVVANQMQKDALDRLEYLRASGENKALVIAATGSGKTYLAALDVKNYNPKKVLFLVHRENILLKAKQSFENICENKTFGIYSGNQKQKDVDYLFSTIQSMSSNCDEFLKDEFDYIIVDEAHHISSLTYKKVLKHFSPKFLLGLTATPNRMDGENIYSFFDDNIACDIRLNDALTYKLVVPFHYYGISDIKAVDYSGVDIKKINELAKLLMVNSRIEYIIEKMNFYSYSGEKRKVLGFCASKEHAKFMADEFNKKGIYAVALTSIDSIEKREDVIKQLEDENNSLEVIFSVDIFNEGVDIPSVNTVLMLRPTNSPIVFIQQLGRGLRKHKDKEFLTLLDFIGNHNKAYLIALALIGNKAIDKDSMKLSLLNNFANIPNAHIYMDEISKQRILKQLDEENFNSFKYLKEQYFEVKSKSISIPTMLDYIEYDELISPLNFIDESKSYVEFITRVEKSEELKSICSDESFLKAIRFIEFLLPIKRVYEFVVIKYLLDNEYLDIDVTKVLLSKYLKVVNSETIIHSFEYLDGRYFDKAQSSRYLRLIEFDGKKVVKTKEFEEVLKGDVKREFIKNSLEYGIISYEKSFELEDYGMPFLKLYEKYNMLNIAQLCNFNKIHSSFRGSGFLKYKDDFFLFITIEKDKFSSGAKYQNDFLDKERFTFISKPLHSQEKGDGMKLCDNKKYGIKLHIFTRKFSQVDKKTQGFLYIGLADTISYSDNKPISLVLKLQKSLNEKLYEEFTKVVD